MLPEVELLGIVDCPGGPVGEGVEPVAFEGETVGGLVLPGCLVVDAVG